MLLLICRPSENVPDNAYANEPITRTKNEPEKVDRQTSQQTMDDNFKLH